jgi:hypothetical protein
MSRLLRASVRVLPLAITAALSAGCYELTVRNGLPAQESPVVRDRFTGGFVNGLVDEEPVLKLNALCPNGWAEIHYEESFINGLLNGIRGLIYTSTSVSVYCAVPGALPAPPPGVVVLAPPPGQIVVLPPAPPGPPPAPPAPPAPPGAAPPPTPGTFTVVPGR